MSNAHSNDRHDGHAALESLGHLRDKVCMMWGSPELDVFISRLIMDARDGQRKGLPVQAAAELLFLAQTNKIIRAIDLIGKQKMTLKEAYQVIDAGDQKRLENDELDNPLVSRDTVIRQRNEEYRSTRERSTPAVQGPLARLGSLIFGLLLSKNTLYLIAFALTLKLLWPTLVKLAG
jgi:hypothetical protein